VIRRALAWVAVPLALSACTGSGRPLADPSAALSDGAAGVFSVGGCPVDEPRFCQEASALANALTQANADAVLTLSRPARFECAELDVEVYPQCEDRVRLRGYTIGTPRGTLSVVTAEEYRDRLGFLVETVDGEYADELGGPGMRILGVSTCGEGEDRSYHLVYTAALADPAGLRPGTRFLGTYELTRRDRGWAIAAAFFGPLAAWERVLADPLAQIGCGGIRSWGTATG
jgi:hypothetical protein